MKRDRIVVLGTGTDVGKTYVSCALALALRQLGHSVLGLKPVESGIVEGKEMSGDAGNLEKAAGRGAPPLYALPEPVSPHLAARSAGSQVRIESIAKWVTQREQLASSSASGRRLTLIETAGGAFSPLSTAHTNADLARALDPALWLLVAPDSLGVLHDVQATARALAPRQLDAVCLSAARAPDASSGSNANELEAVTFVQLTNACPRSGKVPVVERHSNATVLAQVVLQLLQN